MFESTADILLDRIEAAAAARDAELTTLALAVADALVRDAFKAAGRLRGNQWLRAYTESSREESGRLLRLGRLLARHRATREAVEEGRLPIARAAVLAAAVTDSRRRHYDRVEDILLEQAAKLARVDDVEVVVAHWCALVDQDVAAPSDGTVQRLHLQHRLDGGASVHGELDAPTADALVTGLHAYDTGPDLVDGPLPARGLAERRADALGDLARHALRLVDGGSEAGGGGAGDHDENAGAREDGHLSEPAPKPNRNTNMVIDIPSLAGRTTEDLDGIIATLDGRPLGVWAVERLLCDSWVAALVTDADGAVIDATDRIADFTTTQRRIIAARDRHCVFPGCDLPSSWCDVHHVHWRSHGGGRPLDNGVLLCRRHHTLLHLPPRQRWTLGRDSDGCGWQATSPTGRVWTGRPGSPGREPPGELVVRPAA